MSVSNQLLSWNNITYNTCFINNKLCFYYLDNPSNEDLYNQRNLNLKTIRTVDNYAKVNVVGISIDESGTISRKVIYTNGDFVTTSLENYGGLFDSYLRLFSKKTEKFARIE
ncbi:MAG: hypothetical protein IPJ32_06430 [Sphingobacteriaceae bacterium]|nr:hypothetical protein [Sphingobacteriaceae bacterium]